VTSHIIPYASGYYEAVLDEQGGLVELLFFLTPRERRGESVKLDEQPLQAQDKIGKKLRPYVQRPKPTPQTSQPEL